MPALRNQDTGRFELQDGQYIDSKGYWRYSAGEYRGQRVHRVLMAKHLGRPLRKDEICHHRDTNKLNNGLHWDGKWNLEVLGEREHNAVSSKQYWFLSKFVWPLEKQEWDKYHANCESLGGGYQLSMRRGLLAAK